MARAKVCLSKQKRGSREREIIVERIHNDPANEPSTEWVRGLIKKRYPEFVITDDLILLSQLGKRFYACRSCKPEEPNFYVFQYLDITILKEKAAQPKIGFIQSLLGKAAST